MKPETRILNNCIGLLEQAIRLTERIGDDLYVSTSPLSPRGSIGDHLRHNIDFYQNFMLGMQSGHINYNLRQRGLLIERASGVKHLRKTISSLRSLSSLDGERQLLVSAEEDIGATSVCCASSVLRELNFLQSHTVHHYSLIAMLLRLHEIDPGNDFGVAPSTLRHWKEEAICAQ